MSITHTLDEIIRETTNILQQSGGFYNNGKFFLTYIRGSEDYIKDITEYMDEEMKILFQTLELLKDHPWSLSFKIIDKGDYYDIDVDSIH